MGYSSRVTEGYIKIFPPLNSKEIKRFPKFDRPTEIELEIQTTHKEVEEGDLLIMVSNRLQAVEPDSEWSRYSTPKQLQKVLDTYPDREFSGYLQFLGEDGAVWRLQVKNISRSVVEVRPVWNWTEPEEG